MKFFSQGNYYCYNWQRTGCFVHYCVYYCAVSAEAGNCKDGDIKLVGGMNATLGRVEICINNAWGTICNTRFGHADAVVICKQLGYNPTGKSS